MRVEDVTFEGGETLEGLIAGYWHIQEGYEKAFGCTNPDCHHAEVSKEDLQVGYDRAVAQICHKIVSLITEVY